MLATVKGIYNQGKITLIEQPPLKTKPNVIITFFNEDELLEKPLLENQIKLGGLEGKIEILDNFNDPLLCKL